VVAIHKDALLGYNAIKDSWPIWAVKLMRRLAALPSGRYQIVLTVDGTQRDWTVLPMGKVEIP